ncbi:MULTISPECIES: hypoxanthine-guanine phosphoribosyltransferase [Methylobacillus]|uniref:Phosphoribosyltransferase n=1 Tax=Methylobacillus flagellatus (strain ATCC 51484 / DSM 6875 / VKM B-1610 / KT) TaxID=265072 RepID=Q1H1T9_METFK|nr:MULTISPECIES: hypoxanthine-guanine phosphoribosyltransferase [Methylobacillus]ABE49548.1 phosphoribosyltransferase [Methylobacillus flagellatus KT]
MVVLEGNPDLILQRSTLVSSEEEVKQAVTRVAQEITATLRQDQPLVLCVMGGGVVFTGQLLPQLVFPLEFGYVQATRYHNRTHGDAQLVWKMKPGEEVRGRTVLLLDDILDEGVTLAEIKAQCLALGASKVVVAVLVEKMLGRVKPIRADFVGLEVPDQYVFGCGMDAYGWWRNLPAIYAMQGEA